MSQILDPPAQASPVALSVGRRWAWLLALTGPLLLGPPWVALLARVPNVGRLGTWSGLVLILLVAVCSVTDLRRRRIPNWATYSAFLWAMLLNGFDRSGGLGFGEGLAGAAVCFTLMLFIYRMAGGGAGDVKLATALGGLLGLQGGLNALILTYLVAGIAVVCWVLWTVGPILLLVSLARRIGSVLWPGRIAPPTGTQQELLQRRIPLALFFAAGAVPVLLGVDFAW